MMGPLARDDSHCALVGSRPREGSEFRRLHRVRIRPFARRRNATRARTLETQFAAPAVEPDHQDPAARDGSATAFANPFVIERIPIMEFIEVTEEVELVFRREL